jgi:serine/threonine protein phosphatase PrpC
MYNACCVCFRERVALYAVFDGHGGARASRFASQYLHKILQDKFPKGNARHNQPCIILLLTFVMIQYIESKSMGTMYSGICLTRISRDQKNLFLLKAFCVK